MCFDQQTTKVAKAMARGSKGGLWACVATLLCFASGTPLATADETTNGMVTLRVGEVGEPLALIAGIEKGFFAQRGLQVKAIPLSGGPALISATIGGSTDLNYGDVFSWVAAINNGFKVKLIQPANEGDASPNLAEGTSRLLVSRSSGIKTAVDLKGKKIGIAPTQLTQLTASLWIDRHGGDSSTVTFVPVTPYLAMGAALKGGHVDAILDVDPFTQRDITDNGFVVLGTPSREILDGASTAAYYATQGWLEKHGDIAERFVGAYRRAAAWANHANPEEKAATIAKFGTIDLKALEAEIPGLVQNFHYSKFDSGPINVAATQAWVDLAAQYHLLAKSVPIKDELYPTATATTVE